MAGAPVFIFVFIFGLLVGSFSNVCILRIPRNESVIRPGSRCPFCSEPIKWFDNIPLLSFVLLGGKCRKCRKKISPRYFLIELLTAAVYLLLYLRFGLSPEFFIFLAFSSSLIIMSFIDIDHRIIPDGIDIPGIVAGLALSAAYPPMHTRIQPWGLFLESPVFASLANSVSGILLGGGILAGLGVFGKMIFKKEAMGGGDIKLIAMIGAFTGWQLVLLTIFISAVIGSIAGLIMKLKTNSSYIPYGPYLALGGLISVFAGEEIISWYLQNLI